MTNLLKGSMKTSPEMPADKDLIENLMPKATAKKLAVFEQHGVEALVLPYVPTLTTVEFVKSGLPSRRRRPAILSSASPLRRADGLRVLRLVHDNRVLRKVLRGKERPRVCLQGYSALAPNLRARAPAKKQTRRGGGFVLETGDGLV